MSSRRHPRHLGQTDPEAEKKYLGGVSAQYESEVVYHKIKKELDDIGVLFTDMDSALRDHPDLVKEHFGTLIPSNDNKFAALNTAVWSGGSFIYVPPGVQVDIPLQAYFRINAENMGQFERTSIIADEGSMRTTSRVLGADHLSDSLHSAVVEIKAMKGARVRHDHPELVDERLQPRHEARGCLRGRRDGVGRRQHRLEGHMKYPSITCSARRARRGAVGGLRRKGMHTDAGGKRSTRRRTRRATTGSPPKDGGRTGYRCPFAWSPMRTTRSRTLTH